MKKLVATIIAAVLVLGANAQTNTTPSDQVSNLLGSVSFPVAVQLLVSSIENSSILQATNYSFDPYLTYAPKADTKFGAGLLAVYNVPSLNSSSMGVGAALGVDWLGSWSLVSGNVTIKAVTHPLAHIGILSGLPDSIKNVAVTPFALAGIGTPLGSGTQGAATIWDIGESIRFGHWLGGNFDAGFTWGEWMNAGNMSGHRYHIFVGWSKGF